MAPTRTPKQKRSIETKNKIKETALCLFTERGYNNVSTNEIAKAAGISIVSLYSYYSDKKEIYKELVYSMYEDLIVQVMPQELGEALSPFDLIRNYVVLIMNGHSYMTSFQKEITALSYQSEEFRQLEVAGRAFAARKIGDLLTEYRDYIHVEDREVTTFMIQTTLEAVIHEYMYFPNGLDREKVINETTEMLYRYLFHE